MNNLASRDEFDEALQRRVSESLGFSHLTGGIDNDIVRLLFSLDSNRLSSFFHAYEQRYGSGSAIYARRSYAKWKHGHVRFNRTSLAKFVEVVPRILSSEERYRLVKKIHEATKARQSHSIELVLGTNESKVRARLRELFDHYSTKPSRHVLPESVLRQMSWLCDNDVSVLRAILLRTEEELMRTRLSFATAELGRLSVAIGSMDRSMVGTHEIVLPYGTITVTVRHPSIIEQAFHSLFGAST